MLHLKYNDLDKKEMWSKADIELPKYDIKKIVENTYNCPKWVHFGAGNIFRGFIAALQQRLLNLGLSDNGIIAVESFDFQIIDKIYKPYDNLSLLVLMNPDSTLDKEVIASVVESVKADAADALQWERLQEIFKNPSLQMVSLTITEKGYALSGLSGEFFPVVKTDIEKGSECPKHTMSIIASLLYMRYKAGKYPVSIVSMDNCSKNGEKLFNSVYKISEEWVKKGYIEEGFLSYLSDENLVAFPWSMIDKITPHPSEYVKNHLSEKGVEDINIVLTNTKTLIAPFVNTEIKQYLVIEDMFPNGRPPLEKAGVLFTDRDTVEKTEKMKVSTCLNPLHTALAIFGCLLVFTSIASEMEDEDLKLLVEKIAYEEGMPVVVNPGIINPEEFVREVISERFPNPFIPDTPQRIAADTSQKMPIRFGQTLSAYINHSELNVKNLKYIPLVFAGWCRYLIGIDDKGEIMELSPDPMLEELQSFVKGVELGCKDNCVEKIKPILCNKDIFGVDLYEAGLGVKTEKIFIEMLEGKGSVRKVLHKYLS